MRCGFRVVVWGFEVKDIGFGAAGIITSGVEAVAQPHPKRRLPMWRSTS